MTDPSPQELAATVRAGIARERQQAQAATPGPWRAVGATIRVGDPTRPPIQAGVILATTGEREPGSTCTWHRMAGEPSRDDGARNDAAHIAAHDPARVLADCDRAEADLAAWEAVLERHRVDAGGTWCDRCDHYYAPCMDELTALAALARLAATYGGEG